MSRTANVPAAGKAVIALVFAFVHHRLGLPEPARCDENSTRRYSQPKAMQKIMTIAHRTVLVVALLLFAGCGKGGCTVSSSSSSDFNINGRKTSHKTITRTHDGVTRRLETTADVEIQNGQVTQFPQAALIKLWENGRPVERQAELREKAGKLELWIQDKGGFRRGSAEEEAWLKRFLDDITTK
jgi:hypothetical protein